MKKEYSTEQKIYIVSQATAKLIDHVNDLTKALNNVNSELIVQRHLLVLIAKNHLGIPEEKFLEMLQVAIDTSERVGGDDPAKVVMDIIKGMQERTH